MFCFNAPITCGQLPAQQPRERRAGEENDIMRTRPRTSLSASPGASWGGGAREWRGWLSSILLPPSLPPVGRRAGVGRERRRGLRLLSQEKFAHSFTAGRAQEGAGKVSLPDFGKGESKPGERTVVF